MSYGSFATTPHQADDLEAVCAMYASKRIKCFAQYWHFTVITDNSHVLHMNKWVPTNARQRQMLACIMQFDISFVFIKGSRNCLANALSRMYQDSSKQERLDNVARYMHEANDFILPVTQKSVLHTSPAESTDRSHNAQRGECRKSPKTVAIATRSMSKQLTSMPEATSSTDTASNETDKTPEIQGVSLKVG